MVLQSSGQISMSQIQAELGGNNPICFSEYYANAITSYTINASGGSTILPNIGS